MDRDAPKRPKRWAAGPVEKPSGELTLGTLYVLDFHIFASQIRTVLVIRTHQRVCGIVNPISGNQVLRRDGDQCEISQCGWRETL